MNEPLRVGTIALAFTLLLTGTAAAQSAETAAAQQDDTATTKERAEDAATRSKLEKTHVNNGNSAVHDAQAIRQQVPMTTGAERSALLAKMNADYQVAVTEYEEALKETKVTDEALIGDIGLLRLLRNGLLTQEKAVEMVVQDKNLPVIMSNLGIAYSGLGDYQDAIPMLEEATLTKPDPATYMELGTDLAETGKLPEASTTCDKIPTADSLATQMLSACYKNIGIVLTNGGKLGDAISPLRKATQLNPNDATSWKLLGDALSNTITTTQEKGKLVYVIPPGTIEAYQKYLQLEPNGPYAGQVKTVLDSFAQMPKASATSGTQNTP